MLVHADKQSITSRSRSITSHIIIILYIDLASIRGDRANIQVGVAQNLARARALLSTSNVSPGYCSTLNPPMCHRGDVLLILIASSAAEGGSAYKTSLA